MSPETLDRCLVLDRLVQGIQKPCLAQPGTFSEVDSQEIEDGLERGWIYSSRLESLLAEMDPRLKGFSISELTDVFDFAEHSVWDNSKKAMPERSAPVVAMRDAAYLLIQLKAIGFSIDDTILTLRLRPKLADKKFLVGREFYIYWQEQLEAKRDAFVLHCAPNSHASTTRIITLPNGHTMHVTYHSGRATGIEVTRPDAEAPSA